MNSFGYDLDNILLIPNVNNLYSRKEVDLSTFVEKDNVSMLLNIPIIASPMKGIISREIIAQISELGGLGIMHRFYDRDQHWKNDLVFCAGLTGNFGVAVGLGEMSKVELAVKYGAKLVCIDVANGYIAPVRQFVSAVNEKFGKDVFIMTGNVVTEEGVASLTEAGADFVRIGIGSGNLCTTRKVTGVGIPQATAIEVCSQYWGGWESEKYIVADGGIKSSGDIVKCLALGADFVMIGSMFAKTFESAHNGIIYGMASRRLQEEYYHSVKSVEGIEKEEEKTIHFKDLMEELTEGIRSAFTYLGASSLLDLKSMPLERIICP